MANSSKGSSHEVTFAPGLFYSSAGRPRSRHVRLEDPDIMFAALGNGDLSEVEDDDDEVDEEPSLADMGDASDNESATSTDEECDKVSTEKMSWRRRASSKPETEFHTAGDENENDLDSLPTPYDYFSQYVPKSVFVELADKTNMYSIFQEGKSVQTNEEEIRKLISLHLAMGVMRYPRLRLYWKPSLKTELLSSVNMSRNRFEKLRNCLHIVDVNGPHDSNDRLWKVRPLLNSFLRRCQALRLEEHRSLDEQIIPFKGKLDIKQYIKGKPNPWGVKVFMLCGAFGIIHDFLVYQGSTTELNPENKKGFGVTGAFVLHLARSIPDGIGHKLFFDNYFTSLPVLRVLLERKIYAAGTVRSNRTEKCPLKSEKQLKQEGRGSSDSMVSGDGKLILKRWMDNRAVTMASNFLGIDGEDEVSRWSKADGTFINVKRPAVVREYNRSMGGVDKTDFLISLYRTSIRSRKWTLKAITHFMNLAVTNSWLEYRRQAEIQRVSKTDQMDLLEFTLSIVTCLAKAATADQPRKRGRPSSSPLQPLKRQNWTAQRPASDVRYDQIGHWPRVTAEQQRCKLEGCKGKSKNMCEKCNVHLCITSTKNCFKAFHLV
ncbi:piggyBac transposable element-derived protein 3-like [Dermacentor silvarum]|uniref:piggyBac transposable element-derived protein 3-like n=1 Tax=Dermacentor silvarum TaxID=543639 RepID=UPI002101D399|nr:piggyBac transposable element-derived protein 3-like [Dermacentor silvarum]